MKRRILLAALACALSWVLSVSALASGYPAPPDQGYTVSYAKVFPRSSTGDSRM